MRPALLTLTLVSFAVWAQPMYRWTDRSGQVHYTDDLSTVPRGVKVESTDGQPVMVVTTPPTPARKKAEPLATPRPARPSQSGPVEVTLTKVETDLAAGELEYIKKSLASAAASPEVANWGPLRRSVEVHLVPSSSMSNVDAFGEASGETLMRLRTPRELSIFGRPLPYDRVAIHELAHLIEHQLAGQARPRWFAEGFAEYVCQQDPHASIEDMAWWVIHEGGARPLDRMFARENGFPSAVAYAVAKQALQFMASLVGDEGIKKVLQLRAQGQRFDAALTAVLGFPVDEFQTRFAASLKPHYYERAR